VEIGGTGHRVPSRGGRRRGVVLEAVIGDAGGGTERVKVHDGVDARGLPSSATRAA